jgi:hypothetical protein
VGQSVSSVAVQSGLCVDERHPPPGFEGYVIGTCADEDDSAESDQDRCRNPSQHTTDPFFTLQ